jgi:hypothetical protein
MNVVGVRRLASEMILQHLKDMAQAPSVVDVDVGDALVTLHKKRKLQVPKVIVSLKTAGRSEVLKLARKVVKTAVDGVEQSGIDVVLYLFPQFFIHEGEEAIPPAVP